MTYAFTFDARACSGCKACQEACKDKNGLPVGVLWRRVIEVSGGKWYASGNAWENTVFAYHFSLSCNHCSHPKCAGVCPTNAYDVRPDGIVVLDGSKCMGCGYCSWACPYGAPQYDQAAGVMTKCDFCYDNLDAGLPPTCVAACPLRVLDYGSLEGTGWIRGGRQLWQLPGAEHPFPLPEYSRTEPHLLVKIHPGMDNALAKNISNREEILPPGSADDRHGLAGAHELPLVAFTLLSQMAAGIAACGLALARFPLPVVLATGTLLGAGGLASFLHLGRKRNAWRALIHVRKSWLSREILMAGLFGIALVAAASWERYWKSQPSLWPIALLGLALVYCMSRVYKLRAVPSWNTWRTPVGFFMTTALLGTVGTNILVPAPGLVISGGVLLAAEVAMSLGGQPVAGRAAGRIRTGLLVLGILLIFAQVIFPLAQATWMAILTLMLVLAAEAIGRWQFYAGREPFPIRSF